MSSEAAQVLLHRHQLPFRLLRLRVQLLDFSLEPPLVLPQSLIIHSLLFELCSGALVSQQALESFYVRVRVSVQPNASPPTARLRGRLLPSRAAPTLDQFKLRNLVSAGNLQTLAPRQASTWTYQLNFVNSLAPARSAMTLRRCTQNKTNPGEPSTSLLGRSSIGSPGSHVFKQSKQKPSRNKNTYRGSCKILRLGPVALGRGVYG